MLVLVWRGAGNGGNSLLPVNRKHTVLEDTLPLILCPLHLVIHAQHDLRHLVLILIIDLVLLGVVKVRVDGILVLLLRIPIQLWYAD